MEQNVIKTIREAFNIAYFSKLLKESSEDLASKLNPDEFAEAEKKYPSWVSGRLPLRWGKADGLGYPAQNYIIEKAVEEYKQSGDKKIHDALSAFYYPAPGSFLSKMMKKDGRLMQALRKRYGNSWEGAFDDVSLNAWTQSLGDVSKFEDSLQKYTKDGAYGIGPLLKTQLENETLRLAMKSAGKKRGGDQRLDSLDSDGFDQEGNRKFDISGGINANVEASALDKENDIDSLADTFNQVKTMISEDETLKNPLMKIVLVNYLNGKKAFETVAENPEIVDRIVDRKADSYGGDRDRALKQVKNEANSYPINYFKPNVGKYYVLLDKAGVENGLPQDWLDNIYKEGKFIEIAKFISSYKGGSSGDWQEPNQDDDLVFEKFIQNNMNKIMEEVYKRISK